jgi:uncharacterized membrane protein YvbJ
MALSPCPKCGQQCPDDVLRCPSCGARVRWGYFKVSRLPSPQLDDMSDQVSEFARTVIVFILGMVIVMAAAFYLH